MAKPPLWMNDLVLRREGAAFGLSAAAAGELIAELAAADAEAFTAAARKAAERAETDTERDQLERLAGGADGERLEVKQPDPVKSLSFSLQPSTLIGESRPEMPSLAPMDFAVRITDLDGTHWGLETIGWGLRERAIVEAALPFLLEGKPLAWLTQRLHEISKTNPPWP